MSNSGECRRLQWRVELIWPLGVYLSLTVKPFLRKALEEKGRGQKRAGAGNKEGQWSGRMSEEAG